MLMQREKLKKIAATRPSHRQLAWQELEFTCFIHYGMNSFTDRHWGTGRESPSLFNPSAQDCGQWARAARAAGMKMMTLTVKHHDGFCLWPSRYTLHSVAYSRWNAGQGDVLRELSAACREHDLKLGVYLSPADLAEAIREGGRYANGSKVRPQSIPLPSDRPCVDDRTFEYEVDDYNAYFMSQLFETLTEYGPVHQVWFDGAHPRETRSKGTQVYQFDAWYDLIRQLAPEAVISVCGPDTRWCGNEAGITRQAEWSVLPLPDGESRLTGDVMEAQSWDCSREDLPCEEWIEACDDFAWYPAETNTTIRPGWFYCSSLKSKFDLYDLMDIYYRAVGGNSVFLLNISPDPRGLVPEDDVAMLHEMGIRLREAFVQNLAEGAQVAASATRQNDSACDARHILEPSQDRYWATDDWVDAATLTFELPETRHFNLAVIQESVKHFGQRITGIALDAMVAGEWQEVAGAASVGYKRMLCFEGVKSKSLRLRITGARVCPSVSYFALHHRPVMHETPRISRNKAGQVSIETKETGFTLHYTLDGTAPTSRSAAYQGVIELPNDALVKAALFTGDARVSAIREVCYDVAPVHWRVLSDEPDAQNVIDCRDDTFWHRKDGNEIVIDFGETLKVSGFTYHPRGRREHGGVVEFYSLYLAASPDDWGLPVCTGCFEKIRNEPHEYAVAFRTVTSGRFIKLVADEVLEGKGTISARSITVTTG